VSPTLLRAAFAGTLGVVLLVYLLANVAAAQGRLKGVAAGHDYARTITSGGRARKFLVHVPTGYDRTRQWPLAIVLHGGGGEGRKVAALTRFSELADEAGFIVVYPDAVNGHWNDGRGVRHFKAQREGVDDVRFIATLIDRLERDLGVDPRRVWATGISNGAMMCHRLGCELSDRVSAIAPVAGSVPESLFSGCRPQLPVSVLLVNGTADPLVPYGGGGVGLGTKRGRVIPVRSTADFWVNADGCPAVAARTRVLDADPRDGMRTVVEEFGPGRDSSEVLLYTVEGGGHTWPSGAERPHRFGRVSRDFDATRTIWEFFEKHPRQ
jgi:polyhydroxybutyrate depolymerase